MECFLLEEEVISNKLFALFLSKCVKRVELASEVASVWFECLSNSGHDFDSLFVCDAWSKSVIFKVTTNTDTSWNNHCCIFLRERWAIEFWGVHVGDVFSINTVFVIHLNDLIEELVESFVWIMGSGITANSWVDVLGSRQDASSEWNSSLIWFIFVLIPNIFGHSFWNKRLLVFFWP